MKSYQLVATVFLAMAAGSMGIKNSAPVAQTLNGTIQGRHLAEFSQDLFLGIPFARAPRLNNPAPWNETYPRSAPFDASAYGPTCYGFGSNTMLNLTQSEECLNLNIIRPAGLDSKAELPILLWMYGGGWRQGSSADPMWNMSYIVAQSVAQKQPIIGVSVNYRLSFLGFPSSQEVLDAGVANLGVKDQRASFRWIKENIAAFGGDPSKLTIWVSDWPPISAIMMPLLDFRLFHPYSHVVWSCSVFAPNYEVPVSRANQPGPPV